MLILIHLPGSDRSCERIINATGSVDRNVRSGLQSELITNLVRRGILQPYTRGGEAVEPQTDLFFRFSVGFAIYIFFVGFWIRAGRTLGMQSWRLTVEKADGGKPGIMAGSVRFLAALVSWLPLGLGFWWAMWDKDRLTWHDRWSGTRLVYHPK